MADAKVPKELQDGQEIPSNWWKPENIGDFIKGTLMNKTFKKSNDADFPDQWIYEIKKFGTDEMWNVGISARKTGTISRLNKSSIGEIVSILFEKEIPASKPTRKPAKALKVMTHGIDTEVTMDTDDEPEDAI